MVMYLFIQQTEPGSVISSLILGVGHGTSAPPQC
jgi:hypothetical protein